MSDDKHAKISEKLAILQEFYKACLDYQQARRSHEDIDPLRTRINKLIVPAKSAVLEAGTMKLVTIGPPPMVGGMVRHNMDPFHNIYDITFHTDFLSMVIDCVEQAIGTYEYALAHIDSDLPILRSRDAIDLEASIERALRLAVGDGPPAHEREVQKEVETILRSVGVRFHREKDQRPAGAKAIRPDFTIPDLDLALEVKLCTERHGPSAVQEEINADIAAYRAHWKRILFVVYDVGAIRDPYGFRRENMATFGVTVVIVKH